MTETGYELVTAGGENGTILLRDELFSISGAEIEDQIAHKAI